MNVFRKARELGWEVKQLSVRPNRYWLTWLGDGPLDKYHVTGRKELEALLLAIEEGRSTERWRHPD